MNPILFVAILALIGVVADFFIKVSGNGSKFIDLKWFIIGALLYVSTTFGWFYVMKHMKLSSLGVVYGLITILLLVFVGVFFFHEKLNVYEIIGIITAIISVILLSKFA